jgi:hypothetical protein
MIKITTASKLSFGNRVVMQDGTYQVADIMHSTFGFQPRYLWVQLRDRERVFVRNEKFFYRQLVVVDTLGCNCCAVQFKEFNENEVKK